MLVDSSSKSHLNNLMRGHTIVFGNGICLFNVDKMKDWQQKQLLDLRARNVRTNTLQRVAKKQRRVTHGDSNLNMTLLLWSQ